nr:HD domain-containing phosphohydrolase [Fusibacter ferrireducens]
MHHEHWDGSGYPEGLKGDEIPLIAQIITLADAYDAMTSDRSYRKGISHQQTAEIIISESEKLFNPMLVEAFIHRMSDFEAYYLSIKNER